jgi:hypothetical protein
MSWFKSFRRPYNIQKATGEDLDRLATSIGVPSMSDLHIKSIPAVITFAPDNLNRYYLTFCGDQVVEDKIARKYPYGAQVPTCMGCILARFQQEAERE